MTHVTTYRAVYFDQVRSLWEQAFPDDPPWNRAEVVIPIKVKAQPELFVVALDAGLVVGAALAGYDGHRGWIYSVMVKPPFRRRGIGTKLVREIEKRLTEAGCTRIKLQIPSLNTIAATFCHRIGYCIEHHIDMGKHLQAQSRPAASSFRAMPSCCLAPSLAI